MGNVIAASTPKSSRERKVLQTECREFSLNDINSECCGCFLNLQNYQNQAGRLPSPGMASSQAF